VLNERSIGDQAIGPILIGGFTHNIDVEFTSDFGIVFATMTLSGGRGKA